MRSVGRLLGNVGRLGVKELWSLRRDPVLLFLVVYAFGFAVYSAAEDAAIDVENAAIAVVDHCQGQGLGRLLFLRLMSAAGERGIRTFRNEVLAENQAMQHLLSSIAPEFRTHPDGAALVIDFDLPNVAAETAPDSQQYRGAIYRLFQLVAERVVTIRRRLLELIGQEDD